MTKEKKKPKQEERRSALYSQNVLDSLKPK